MQARTVARRIGVAVNKLGAKALAEAAAATVHRRLVMCSERVECVAESREGKIVRLRLPLS